MKTEGQPLSPGSNSMEETGSFKNDKLPERAKQNKLYKFLFVVCTHVSFTIFITILIILNTIALAMDSYPTNKSR